MDWRKSVLGIILILCIAGTIALICVKRSIDDKNMEENHQDCISYVGEIDQEHVKCYENASVQYVDNELLIQPRSSLSEVEAKKLADKHGANLVGYIGVSGTSQWRFPETKSFKELEILAKNLMDNSDIEFCAINIIEQPSYLQNKCPTSDGVSWDSWYHFDKSFAYRSVGADKIYELSDKMTAPVNIGIIDADFYDHLDLEHMIKDPPVLNEGDEGYGHGSAVASVAAAKADNRAGIAGVYPVTDERIKRGFVGDIYCRAAFDEGKENRITGTNNLMNELNVLADLLFKKCRVINMSYGLSPGILNAIHLEHEETPNDIGPYEKYHLLNPSKMKEYFLKRFINADYKFLLVQAAGNASYHTWEKIINIYPPYKQVNDYNKEGYNIPAEWESSFAYINESEVRKRIIVVGAAVYSGLPNKRYITSFSQHSDRVDIIAPGEGVGVVTNKNNDSVYAQGTSFAAPFVTGTIASIWSVDPDFTSDEVRSFLLNGGKEQLVSDDRPQAKKENVHAVPSLNVYKTLKLALNKTGGDDSHDEKEKNIRMPVYITVLQQESNGDRTPIKNARISIFDEEGNVYKDGGEEYKNIPIGIEQESDYGDTSTLYIFLPDGNYSVAISADGYQSVKVDGLSPKENSKDSDNKNTEYAEWSFLLEQNVNWKAAYRDCILEGEYLEAGQESYYNSDMIDWVKYIDFSLHDLDDDGIPELIVYKAAPMSDSLFNIYTCKRDGTETLVSYIGDIGFRDGDLIVAPSSKYKGIYFAGGNMDYYQGHYYSLKEGKLHDEYVDEIRAQQTNGNAEFEYFQATEDVELFHTFSGAFGKYDELDMRLSKMGLKALVRKSQNEIIEMGWDNYLHECGY